MGLSQEIKRVQGELKKHFQVPDDNGNMWFAGNVPWVYFEKQLNSIIPTLIENFRKETEVGREEIMVGDFYEGWNRALKNKKRSEENWMRN